MLMTRTKGVIFTVHVTEVRSKCWLEGHCAAQHCLSRSKV